MKKINISYLTSHKGNYRDLLKCMRSVYYDSKRYDYIHCEHLICMDGYKESDVISEIKTFPNSTLYFNKENKGKSASINKLLRIAKGDYFFFIDSDDWNLQGRTIKQLEKHLEINQPESTVIGTNYLSHKNGSIFLSSSYPINDYEIKLNFWRFPFLLFSSMSFHRKLFDTHQIFFNEELRAGLDYEFYARLFQFSNVYNLNEELVNYSYNPNSLTRKKETRIIQLNAHYNTLISLFYSPSFNTKPFVDEIFRFIIQDSSINRDDLKLRVYEFCQRIIQPEFIKTNYFPNSISNSNLSKYFLDFLSKI